LSVFVYFVIFYTEQNSLQTLCRCCITSRGIDALHHTRIEEFWILETVVILLRNCSISIVYIQELVNKAQHVVHIESGIDFICCPWPMWCKPRLEPIVKICSHSQCKCDFRKMEPEIVEQLTRIVKRRQLLEHAKEISSNISADSNNAGTVIESISKILTSSSLVQSSIARPATSSGRNVSDAPNMVQDILELFI
jgi:hypothetical protein